jgi:hypothetical protein
MINTIANTLAFFEKYGRRGIVVLTIVACLWVLYSTYNDYAKKQETAFLIYPELIDNIAALDAMLDKEDKVEHIYFFNREKFSQEAYRRFYKYFGKPKIDTALANFYVNIGKSQSEFKKNDLLDIKGQGDQAAQSLSYYFGCKDWYDSRNSENNNMNVRNIASADIVGLNPCEFGVGYWRYVSLLWKILIIFILLISCLAFKFYKKITSMFGQKNGN